MKKATNFISFLILMMVLVGCSKETVLIDFPFEVGDVENIEMYHYAGAPVSAEKKIVVAKTDITDLYHMFENLSLTDINQFVVCPIRKVKSKTGHICACDFLDLFVCQ